MAMKDDMKRKANTGRRAAEKWLVEARLDDQRAPIKHPDERRNFGWHRRCCARVNARRARNTIVIGVAGHRAWRLHCGMRACARTIRGRTARRASLSELRCEQQPQRACDPAKPAMQVSSHPAS